MRKSCCGVLLRADPASANARYILALMLERKRILRPVESRDPGSACLRAREHRRDLGHHRIPASPWRAFPRFRTKSTECWPARFEKLRRPSPWSAPVAPEPPDLSSDDEGDQPRSVDEEYEGQFFEDGKVQIPSPAKSCDALRSAPSDENCRPPSQRARKERARTRSRSRKYPCQVRMVNDERGCGLGPVAGGLEGIQIRFCVGLDDGDRQIGSSLDPLPVAPLQFREGRSHIARNQSYLGGVYEPAAGSLRWQQERTPSCATHDRG